MMFELFRGFILVMCFISIFFVIVEEFDTAERCKLTRFKNSRIWPVLSICTAVTFFFSSLFMFCFILFLITYQLSAIKNYLLFLLPFLPILSFYLTRFFIKSRPLILKTEKE